MSDPTLMLTAEQRALLLAPCVCGHTINDHGSLAPCWVCAEDGQGECAATFEAILAERIARMVADAEARALREAADPTTLDHATHFCGWRVLDHDMQPRPVDACKMPTAVALADWLRARADSLAAQPAPEEGCSSCGLYGGGHAHPDCEGAQPAPEAATVEEQHCPTCACGCTCGYGGLHEPENPNCDLVRRKP